jgi:hypothetical protein
MSRHDLIVWFLKVFSIIFLCCEDHGIYQQLRPPGRLRNSCLALSHCGLLITKTPPIQLAMACSLPFSNDAPGDMPSKALRSSF